MFTKITDGFTVASVSVSSPGARQLRVHLRGISAGTGEIWIYAPGSAEALAPLTGRGPFGDGEAWSGTIDGDTVIVAYAGRELPGEAPFEVDAIAHQFATSEPYAGPNSAAASCNLDVSCYADYRGYGTAVARYSFVSDDGYTYLCSGALINTRASSLKPYFLTAHHCIASEAEARSMAVQFLYQTASCNGALPSANTLPTIVGGTYLAGAPISQGDYSFVLLTAAPGGVQYLGWNTSLDQGAPAVGIHHPQSSYTRIAFGTRGPDESTAIGGEVAPANAFYKVNWTSGITEPGSSGSPLINSAGQITGTLTSGPYIAPGTDACVDYPRYAWYGRFSNVYPAISVYLNDVPANPPAISLAASQLSFSYTAGAAAPAAQGVMVSNGGGGTLTWSATPGAAWIAVTSSSNTAPSTLTVSVNPAGMLPGTYRGVVNLGGGSASVTLPVTLVITARTGPTITAGGIVNGASYQPMLSPGMFCAIFGTRLAGQTASSNSIPLSTTLGGVTVTFNGVPAAIYFVSPDQVNVQVPPEIAAGSVTVTLNVNGQSDTQTAQVARAAPGIFTDGRYLVPSSAARTGDIVPLYITGQGDPMQAVAVTVGGVAATVVYAGTPAGLVGVTQVNLQVPDSLAGEQAVVVTVAGRTSAPAMMTVLP